MDQKSRYALDGDIITVRPGLAIYKVGASPYYFARIRDSKNKKNIVRSTKETSRIEARKVAEELYQSLFLSGALSKTPKQFTFLHFADEIVKQAQFDVSQGTRQPSHIKDTRFILEQKEWGLLKEFADKDVRELQTKDFVSYIQNVQQAHPHLSSSIHAQLRGTFRKVIRQALLKGVTDKIPETPKLNKSIKQVPRTFFRFYPIVPRERDEYRRLKDVAEDLVKQKTVVRGTTITSELRDIILFLANSFVRPTYSELYALRHSDIEFRQDEERGEEWLLLTIRRGKTGRRITDTMPAAAPIYRRILKHRPDAKPDDYVFLPEYENRKTAARVMMRWFNHLLEVSGLKKDPETGKTHSLYSLRHTALAMRTLNSRGKADLLILAQNAGTSIQMLERFYLNNLPRTKEAVRNLQSFGD
jgi:hypothetical protein